MPPLEVYRGSDGFLMIYDGVTRATRVAKFLPGTLLRAEVIDDLTTPVGHLPKVEDMAEALGIAWLPEHARRQASLQVIQELSSRAQWAA